VSYGAMRAELIIAMPDGYRSTPINFQIPYDMSLQQIERQMINNFEIEKIKFRTKIAELEQEISILKRAIKPRILKRIVGYLTMPGDGPS
jgi:hypothetical protein